MALLVSKNRLARSRTLMLIALAFPLIGQSPAIAQAPASREGLDQERLRQQERERLLRQRQEATPDVRLDAPTEPAANERLPGDETPCFRIQRIELRGDAADRFQWALTHADRTGDGTADAPVGRCLGSRGINLVMKRIQNAIIERGYVTTRILATPQDLTGGTLLLTLLPGRIRGIRFASETSARGASWNAFPAAPGDLLNLRDIEQALENLKRVPTADANIQIEPTKGDDAKPGESDIVIFWQQKFPVRLNLSADDSGSRSTGKYQGGFTFSYDHPWALNDLFYVSFYRELGSSDSDDRGTRGQTIHYSLPLGYWTLGVTASRNRYFQSVPGASQTYVYRGKSAGNELKLSRIVYRDAVRKSHASLAGWTRSSNNFIDDTEVLVQRRRTAGWEIGIGHREFLGAGNLDVTFAHRRGTGAAGALTAPEDAFGEGASHSRFSTGSHCSRTGHRCGERRQRDERT